MRFIPRLIKGLETTGAAIMRVHIAAWFHIHARPARKASDFWRWPPMFPLQSTRAPLSRSASACKYCQAVQNNALQRITRCSRALINFKSAAANTRVMRVRDESWLAKLNYQITISTADLLFSNWVFSMYSRRWGLYRKQRLGYIGSYTLFEALIIIKI